jgi:rod shape-determining protein MreD
VGPFVVFAWAILAGALPDVAPARFGLDRAPPDLWVALAAYLGLRGTGYHVVTWGIVLGLLVDCTSLDPLGTHAFVLGTVTFVFARPRGASRGASGALVPLAVAAATVLARVLYALRCLPLHQDAPVWGTIVGGFPAALSTALVSWPLLLLLDRTGAVRDLTGRRHAARA